MVYDLQLQVVPLAEAAAKCAGVDSAASRPMILIVDDERVIADTLTLILSKHGYATMTAYNGESALEIAALIPPNLLLSDIVMPGMTGIELATRMVKSVSDCKVLLFSGQAATLDLVSDQVYAGTGFTTLAKPIHPTDLLTHIAESLMTPNRVSETAVESPVHIKWTKTISAPLSTTFENAEFC